MEHKKIAIIILSIVLLLLAVSSALMFSKISSIDEEKEAQKEANIKEGMKIGERLVIEVLFQAIGQECKILPLNLNDQTMTLVSLECLQKAQAQQ